MPSKLGSDYHNYKQYFSVILLVVVDSDYWFMYVDIGAYGKSSESNLFQYFILIISRTIHNLIVYIYQFPYGLALTCWFNMTKYQI